MEISELKAKTDELNAALEKLIVSHIEERRKSLRLDAVTAAIEECQKHFYGVSHISVTRAYVEFELKKLLVVAKG